MKTTKVYIVTDLGVGDGGKGGIVHKIATMTKAHTVIKRGGAQGSHGIRTSRGESFAFSQWGCGTFEGIPTFLSQQMIISPEGLLNEGASLRYEHGITDPFSLLTVDERALCATPYHGISSRLKELARGKNPRGTVGTGVGEAYRAFDKVPEIAILAKDLKGSKLRELLAASRDYIRRDLEPIIQGTFLDEDLGAVAEEVTLLYSDVFFEHVVERFAQARQLTAIVDGAYLGDEILSREGVAVIETSHGVLSDRLVGFYPHTSAIRTLPRFTRQVLDDAGYDGQVVNLGLSRAYGIRHGAGPMPTADPDMSEDLLPGSNKDGNRYQGKVRVGPLDFVLLRYAIEACGGPQMFDGLAITWFDQVKANKIWNWCNQYDGIDGSDYFSPQGEIRVDHLRSEQSRTELTKQLKSCRPRIESMPIDVKTSNSDLYATCGKLVEEHTGVPVRMVSFGPTERDKFYT